MSEFVPYLVSWNLTGRCNLRCRHCYIDASRAGPDELSTDEALRILGEIAEVSRETMLVLSGGEPLLRPDLDALVSRAAALGMTPVLGTNGTLLTEERARALQERGLAGVGISIDSLIVARHDAFRGREGAWKAAVRGTESARRVGLDVQIQTTLTRENLTELREIARFTRDVGARALSVFFLVCTGRGQGLVDLAPEEYDRVLHALVREGTEGILIRPRCAPIYRRVLAQTHPDSILLHSDAGRCLAGKNYCRITPSGEVTPCPYLPLVAGRLREQTFGEIWGSSPVLVGLRAPRLRGRCGICEYRELCGGCRARAFALKGDPLAEDPWCVYEPGTDRAPAAAARDSTLTWTPEAEARLERVPFFVRRAVRAAVESAARRRGLPSVTPCLMEELRRSREP